jgi:hypothetical protein
MREKLKALAEDLQAVYRWEQENANKTKEIIFAPIEHYTPSKAVLRQNKEQTEYHKITKNFSCGEYSMIHDKKIIYQNSSVTDSEESIDVQNELLKQQFLKLWARLKEWCLENQSELNTAYIIDQ